jgi:hypothetical protein
MVGLFLRLVADAVEELGEEPAADALSRWLQKLAALFTSLELDGRRRLRGLWAELLVMRDLGDPQLLLRRWHADPRETYDFLGSDLAIEVKSCQDMDRVHEFSIRQLNPSAELDVWIASLVVRPDPDGYSVLDLLELIEGEIHDLTSRSALRSMVFAIGGSALEDDEQHRFDLAMGNSTLRLLSARDVPSIREPLPPEVIEATLRVRCHEVPSVGTASDAVARLRATAQP